MIGFTYFGYKKGFLKTVTGLLSIILSFALAVCFYTQVANFIKTTPVYDSIYRSIEKHIDTSKEESDNVYDYGTAELNLPREYVKNMQKSVDGIKENMGLAIVNKTADIAVKILSMLLILLVARILIFILTRLFGLIKKLTLVGWSDRFIGGFFGFIKGFFVSYLILAIITVSATFNPQNFLVRATKQSEFAKVMYNNNVFLDFIYKNWHKKRYVL